MQLSQSFYAGRGLFFWFWLPEQVVSSGKGRLRRRKTLAPVSGSLLGEQCACQRPTPGERMLAGGESFSGCRTSAKPSRPEVTFYRDLHLRQGPSSPAENASAGERAVPRRTACVPATNSGERMLAGGESLSGGRTSAKPSRPEVTVYRDLHLRRELPSPDQVRSLE